MNESECDIHKNTDSYFLHDLDEISKNTKNSTDINLWNLFYTW